MLNLQLVEGKELLLLILGDGSSALAMEGGARGGEEFEGATLPPPPPLPEGADLQGVSVIKAVNDDASDVRGAARARGKAALVALGMPVPKQAQRPGYGRRGRPTQLCANHFSATLVKWDDVFHYNVS